MALNRYARRRVAAALAISTFVGVVLAGFNSGIGPFPPSDEDGLQVATATTHVVVDRPQGTPSAVFRRALPQDQQTGVKHAELLGRVMVSQPVLERVAEHCDVSGDEISGQARTTSNVPTAFAEPDSERRASEIRGSTAPYRIEVQGRPYTPVIDVFTQAPSAAQATCLADASSVALGDYLQQVANQRGVDVDGLAQLREIPGAPGAVVNGHAPLAIAMLTFLVAFALTCSALYGFIALRRRRLEKPVRGPVAVNGTNGNGSAPTSGSENGSATPADDCWPRTTRVLPWMLAAFIAVLWLMPFNTINLDATLPIDLPLDRLILPVIAFAWLIALIAGGRGAPRVRMTWIHAALGAFFLVALLSVVLDAHYLNQTLELELALKKLATIFSYVLLFVIVASVIRRGEVHAFLTFTLVLAVICALGMIYEYRSGYNVFWEWSDKLMPGIFDVQRQLEVGPVVDSIGRRLVWGPAEVPLEAVAMLTFALTIGLVRLIDAKRWGQRALYAVATCILVAAVFATYRKSAFIAPAAVVLALAYYRRRDLLRLAPLGLAVLLTVMMLSPGALGSTFDQFLRSDRTELNTVSDRVADYDAVRPDVWSHLVFGRGWGSYNHETYRILDSEILLRLIETGVIGLVAFLLIGAAVLAVTRRPIAGRDQLAAPVALIGALCAVAFVVFAFLFDTLSFPHVPYIFLYITGLAAVVIRGRERTARWWPGETVPLRRAEDVPPDPSRHPEGSLLPSR
jgi:O-Antigen ligase